jgi:hypothetical protein
VVVTPGTAKYQFSGATSMKTPLTCKPMPSSTANPRHSDFSMVDPLEGKVVSFAFPGIYRKVEWLSQSSKSAVYKNGRAA